MNEPISSSLVVLCGASILLAFIALRIVLLIWQCGHRRQAIRPHWSPAPRSLSDALRCPRARRDLAAHLQDAGNDLNALFESLQRRTR